MWCVPSLDPPTYSRGRNSELLRYFPLLHVEQLHTAEEQSAERLVVTWICLTKGVLKVIDSDTAGDLLLPSTKRAAECESLLQKAGDMRFTELEDIHANRPSRIGLHVLEPRQAVLPDSYTGCPEFKSEVLQR